MSVFLNFFSTARNALSQSVWLPKPKLTEHNTPDQTGRVHLITGGYTGCGLDLAKILYAHNATVVIAGRSADKYNTAEAAIRAHAPSSTGSVSFVQLDLADLTTIAPAVDKFLASTDRLDVLTQNAGVMFPPTTQKTAQGEDLQFGTNCLGAWLLYRLLRQRLVETAARPDVKPGDVRVTWAGSVAIEFLSPRPGGTVMVPDTKATGVADALRPRPTGNKRTDYGQSKVGNLYMSVVGSKRDAKDGVVHVAWNPGNLKTPLYRHTNFIQNATMNFALYKPIFGAYTELYAALSPDITPANSGCYLHPWGRIGPVRNDVTAALKLKSEGGSGQADAFVAWAERETEPFTGKASL